MTIKDRRRRSPKDHVVFTTLAEAQDFAAAVDKLRGPFPRPGVAVGGGRHGEAPTLRHARVRKHPVRDEWAYPVDGELHVLDGARVPARGKQVTINVGQAAPLPPDWDDEG